MSDERSAYDEFLDQAAGNSGPSEAFAEFTEEDTEAEIRSRNWRRRIRNPVRTLQVGAKTISVEGEK